MGRVTTTPPPITIMNTKYMMTTTVQILVTMNLGMAIIPKANTMFYYPMEEFKLWHTMLMANMEDMLPMLNIQKATPQNLTTPLNPTILPHLPNTTLNHTHFNFSVI